MATIAPRPEGGERVLAPAGTYPARVCKFMNLGTRIQEYQGQPKDYPDTLINLTWELPTKLKEFTTKNDNGTEKVEEKPIVISREFTLSMGPKSNLRPIVEGIIGTTLSDDEAYNFDIESLLGMACLITINHKESSTGNTYAKVVSTAPLIKGMEVPEAINEKIIFDVNTATKEQIEALPQFLKYKVTISDEFKKRFVNTTSPVTTGTTESINPEDIPF